VPAAPALSCGGGTGDPFLQAAQQGTTYTRSGQAQAPNVARGEGAIGVSFIFGFGKWRCDKYWVKSVAPCEGTHYEIGATQRSFWTGKSTEVVSRR
jgi:ABC-type Fe3+ transport system substrate-binding protein